MAAKRIPDGHLRTPRWISVSKQNRARKKKTAGNAPGPIARTRSSAPVLGEYFRDHTRTNGLAAFANRKAITVIQSNRTLQGNSHLGEYRRKTLKTERDPVPKNGAAGELFASDLLAVSSGELALPHEEREKELLRIGERFGLRGPEVDKLNTDSLAVSRRKTVEQSLEQLKSMTLTVVDGDFPRELLATQNLTFAEYRMPAKRNSPESYDAKLNKPAPKKQGILKVGALIKVGDDTSVVEVAPGSSPNLPRALLVSILIAAICGVLAFRATSRTPARRHWRA